MLVNGKLYNCEPWRGLTNAHIAKLESIYEDLLRGIPKAHTKTPKLCLHLETGTVPWKLIIIQRRVNYLKRISGPNLGKNGDEILKKVLLKKITQPEKTS